MGSETSRADRSFRCDCTNSSNDKILTFDNHNNNKNNSGDEEKKSCQLLGECSIDSWKNGYAEAANFKETVLYCDRQQHKECSPAFCATRQLRLNASSDNQVFPSMRKVKFAKMSEHFEYNYIPAQMIAVHHLKLKSILCYRDSKYIVHLSKQGISQLGFLNLKPKKFRKFGQKLYECANFKLAGEISPDGSKCLILKLIVGSRVPEKVTDFCARYRTDIISSSAAVRKEELENETSNLNRILNSSIPPRNLDTDVVELLLYNLNTLELLSVNRFEILRSTSIPKFAFDPRHAWKRIALTNFTVRPDNTLSLVELIPPDNYKETFYDPSNVNVDTCLPNSSSCNNINSINSSSKIENQSRRDSEASVKEQWLWCILASNYKFTDISDSQKTVSTSFRLRNSSALPPLPTQGAIITDLRYTPDGRLLVVTILGRTRNCLCLTGGTRRLTSYRFQDGSEMHINCEGKSFDCYVYVLDGNTAQTVHCIQFNRYACLWHTCPTNYAPIFSMCSTRIAIPMDVIATVHDQSANRLGDLTNRHKFSLHGPHVVQVFRLPYNAFSLKSMCRSVLLEAGIDPHKLNLPPKIIEYFKYTPEYKY
ncbi:hypothetical protein HELRODRAFT_174861 [Helobdella robusta]|uniref:SOCS box domain-containing protein n=1 Tax=Helobdella robusta TaxID=6412 RepID=T1F8J8_HELRO|nr:hypothetical protein HELRODRAFT_174861 [Helobdella robusta]ESO01310.1 hypothetical protein HELRODRAFT_174861 [Helobdella robusta]